MHLRGLKMQCFKVDITLILMYINLIEIHGEWTLKGSSLIAVVGTDFVLTCTTPQNTAVPVYVFWIKAKMGAATELLTTNNCNSVNNIWPSYTYNCDNTNRLYNLTIPGHDVSDLHGASWTCGNGIGVTSNAVPITVINPVEQITMNGTTPLVVHVGSTVTIMCTTSPSRPAAYVVWYKGTNSITSDATAVVENQSGDKYVTRSYLSLAGNRGDEGKTIKCEGYNGAPNKVSDIATLEIWYPPPNIQTLTGYTSNVVLYVGYNVTLTCQQEGGKPFSNLSLTCNGKTGVAGGSSTGSLVELELTINSSYNGKTCSCVSTHVVNSYRKVVSVVLNVYYAPASLPQIGGYNNATALNDGATVTVTCTQTGGFPLSDIIWNCMGHSGNTQKSGGQSTSSVTISIDRTYNQKTCTCTATHPDPNINYAKSQSVMFTVYYAARPASKPTISGYVNGTALLEDSTAKHDLTCRQSDCNPLCTLTWDCEGLTGTYRNTQTEAVSIIQVPLQRHYNGKTCKCTAKHTSLAYTDDVSVVISIHYPPDVYIELVNVTEYETSNVKLVCVASGVPPVYNYIGWKQMLGDSTVRTTSQFTGLSDDRRVLTFDNVTFADAGLYSCEVSNNVKSPQTATEYFDVKATAKFKPDTKTYTFYSGIGQQLVVTIPFYSNPPATPSDIKWFNLSDNSVIGNNENTTFDLLYSDFNISLYSVAVSLHGQIAKMHISSFQNYHQGNYSITIANGLSTVSSIKFWIMLRSQPNRPFGIRAVCTSINTAEVIWISKFNGGSIQHFNVFVKVAENVVFKNRENISDPGKDEIVSAIIDNLHDGTQYFFTVFAKNEYGQSPLTNVLNCTTPKKEDITVYRSETGPSVASVVLFVLSSISFACCAIAFAAKRMFKRRKNKQQKRREVHDKALELKNTYQELGEREHPVDQPYQKIGAAEPESRKDERNVYQEISGRDPLDNQYLQIETAIGQPSGSNKGNVYEDLAQRDRPNVYDKIKC